MATTPPSQARVDALRAFNRFWTAQIGALNAGHLATPYSLTEARVLFELAQRSQLEVGPLRADLGLDAGYLSRILARFKNDKLVTTESADDDARKQIASLTAKGKRAFEMLDARAEGEVRNLLARLPEEGQARVVGAMRDIQDLLAPSPQKRAHTLLRSPRPGDLGWVVERHGALYAQEYGWDDTFEALVARIVAEYVEKRDPKRETVLIAEAAGERLGCVFCVKKSAKVAQLRLLLVEPNARGMRLGTLLVDECIRFARAARYSEIALWTNSVLHAARAIYQRAGFQLVREGKHHSFGQDLVEQTWSLDLKKPATVD